MINFFFFQPNTCVQATRRDIVPKEHQKLKILALFFIRWIYIVTFGQKATSGKCYFGKLPQIFFLPTKIPESRVIQG
jgi:hypothetical protein